MRPDFRRRAASRATRDRAGPGITWFDPFMNHQGSVSSCDLTFIMCIAPSCASSIALQISKSLEATTSTSACGPVAQSAQPPSAPLHRKGRISDANLLRRASLRTLRLVQRPESRHRFQSFVGRRLQTPTTPFSMHVKNSAMRRRESFNHGFFFPPRNPLLHVVKSAFNSQVTRLRS